MTSGPDTLAPAMDLDSLAARHHAAAGRRSRRVVICGGTGCLANGAAAVRDAFCAAFTAHGIDAAVELAIHTHDGTDAVHLSKSGCQGFCALGPLVRILPEDLLYVKVKPADVDEIVAASFIGGSVVERLLYRDPTTGTPVARHGDIPFYANQERTVLAAGCELDPEDLAEYVGTGGYRAAERAWTAMSPEAIRAEVSASGLRGRGGGGFSTGRKWGFAAATAAERRYIICNGDEGDPGAFMDRSIMEGNPHSVIEGMLIAARAIGAQAGYIYVRTEYPLAVERVRAAVAAATAAGLLGHDCFGSGAGFTLEVMEGAGAFVCGEETALIASIEGRRGMPMPKPPFPAVSGLWGCPTIINNVETLATIPLIIARGAAAFRAVGTSDSPGTKTFALTGHVANTGLIEVPLGTTLREVVFAIGGGVTDNDGQVREGAFKAVQIGGPSGGCLTAAHLDLPLDYEHLSAIGAMIGSGGLVVMNDHTCMVEVARFFMQFTQHESCGKCVLCREGTRQMLAMLDTIIDGEATPQVLDDLAVLARSVAKGSLCGLGKTAPNPVLSTLDLFREEYEAHVHERRCPAGRCAALRQPEIIADRCRGCTACLRACPVDAITGAPKQVHTLDPATCLRCGACATACRFDAIVGVG